MEHRLLYRRRITVRTGSTVKVSAAYLENMVIIVFRTMLALVRSVAVNSIYTFFVPRVIMDLSPLITESINDELLDAFVLGNSVLIVIVITATNASILANGDYVIGEYDEK